MDHKAIAARLTAACGRYEKSAPPVAEWANDLYIRISEDAAAVVLAELNFADRLCEEGTWMQPNYAANDLYKLLHRLGRDTTGLAGF